MALPSPILCYMSACPDRAGPRSAWRRGAPAELPRDAERAGGDVGEEWPPAGALGRARPGREGCAAARKRGA